MHTGVRSRALLLLVASVVGAATVGCDPAPPPAVHWFCLDHQPMAAADYRLALNHHDTRWQGGDGAVPAYLPNGKVAWIFGDTLYGNVGPDGSLQPGWGMAHGSMIMQDGACFDPFYSATSPNPVSLVPDAPAGELRWPGSGWVSRDGSTFFLTVSRVRIDPNAPFGFQSMFGEIAAFDYPSMAFRSIAQAPTPADPGASNWGSAFADGGFTYLYSTHNFSHFAARFPDSAADPASGVGWQYWTGTGWSSDPGSLVAMGATQSPLASVVIAKTPTGYVMTAKSAGSFSQDVSAWTSTGPAGPWAPKGTIADLRYLPANRTYGGHAVTRLPGGAQLVVWSVSPNASGNATGAGIGVTTPSQPLG